MFGIFNKNHVCRCFMLVEFNPPNTNLNCDTMVFLDKVYVGTLVAPPNPEGATNWRVILLKKTPSAYYWLLFDDLLAGYDEACEFAEAKIKEMVTNNTIFTTTPGHNYVLPNRI